MTTTIVKVIVTRIGKQIVKEAPKYAARAMLGIPCEVGIYFGSKAIIKAVKESTKEDKEVEVIA